MSGIDKLAWLHVRNGRVLAVRSHGRDLYYAPGGKREPGESDTQALVREIREELSVVLSAGTLVFAEEFRAQADGKPVGTEVRMRCYFGDYQGKLTTSGEIAEMRWLDHGDREHCSAAFRIVLDWLKLRAIIE